MFIEMIGRQFGSWLVIERCRQRKSKDAYWVCKCECGTLRSVNASALRSGRSLGCGCKVGERISKKMIRHGWRKMPGYKRWQGMLYRCYCKKANSYKNYGGRGIQVCDRWRRSFVDFLEDMGSPPSPVHTIDRIDVDGNYCPENCRWASRAEQMRNMRKNVRLIHGSEVKTLPEWAEAIGLKRSTLARRIRLGWTTADALTTPLRHQPKTA